MDSKTFDTFLEDLGKDPWKKFEEWFSLALKVDTPNPNTFFLSVCDAQGNPSCRTVLLSEYSKQTGFLFYTNYLSKKSRAMSENPKAEMLFYWDSLFLQVRVFGVTSKVGAEKSDEYFASRTREKQIAAWASVQSEEMKNSGDLAERYKEYEKKFEGVSVPRPENWGGWSLKPEQFEFWKGSRVRMHQRAIFDLTTPDANPKLIYP